MISEVKDILLINTLLKEFNTSINEIGVFSHYLVYEEDNKILGFINYDLIYDRAEISYIFVNSNYRKRGIASKLFDNMLMRIKDAKNISLEVRISNDPAIKFYEKHGFKKVAKREKYYGNEDGILMLKELI